MLSPVLCSTSLGSLTTFFSCIGVDGVTERMTEDNSIKHYKGKADAEREKLQVAEEAASDVQKEFEVS